MVLKMVMIVFLIGFLNSSLLTNRLCLTVNLAVAVVVAVSLVITLSLAGVFVSLNKINLMKRGNVFDTIATQSVPHSSFDLSHDVKLSFNMGEIVPVCVMEAAPGDIFHIDPISMLRMAPMVSPPMHEVNVRTRFFFIPTRLLWAEFTDWIMNNSQVEAPYISAVNVAVGSVADYLGYPTDTVNPMKVSPMLIAAYVKVFDDWFRAKQFTPEKFVPLVAGDNGAAEYGDYMAGSPLLTTWEQDYFTSALPSPQQGEGVAIPLTINNDIPVTYEFRPGGQTQNVGRVRNAADGAVLSPANGDLRLQTGPTPLGTSSLAVDAVAFGAYDPNGTLRVDVQGDAVPLNTLRYAEALQKWLELNERAGDEYIDGMLAHFGVRSSDARLQRSEYIGGFSGNMVISEVLSTAETRDPEGVIVNPVGQMAGHGISAAGGNRFSYRSEEHGFVIGVMTVTPRTAYSQGLPRMLTRFDRYDFLWPMLANLGEQEIRNKEVYADVDEELQEETFGYTPRYSDYKFINSRIAGEFKQDALKTFHFGRHFEEAPQLTDEFMYCRPTFAPFSVLDETVDHIYAHVFNRCAVNRKLPYYGIPSL